jgi:hypothetical protein
MGAPQTAQPDAQVLTELSGRLRAVSLTARKLLSHVAELAYRPAHPTDGTARKPHCAYLPELHESCGLDVEAMYGYLHELTANGLIALEGDYPFEDARLLFPVMEKLHQRATERRISLRDVLAEVRFDELTA